MEKIGFGGGCHWCTEAVFQVLKGVVKVEQGWIASEGASSAFSEAVIVHFEASVIGLPTLVAIHLYTHSCTSRHALRKKYRSAVYTFSQAQAEAVDVLLKQLQEEFDQPIITRTLPFVLFRKNEERYQNYYQKHAGNQFCEAYINPKLQLLMRQYSRFMNTDKID